MVIVKMVVEVAILKKVNVAFVVYFSIFQLTESRSSWNHFAFVILWTLAA